MKTTTLVMKTNPDEKPPFSRKIEPGLEIYPKFLMGDWKPA